MTIQTSDVINQIRTLVLDKEFNTLLMSAIVEDVEFLAKMNMRNKSVTEYMSSYNTIKKIVLSEFKQHRLYPLFDCMLDHRCSKA